MKSAFVLAFLFFLLFGCGKQEGTEGTGSDELHDGTSDESFSVPEADEYLTITDSIGIELGDSNYVFGVIGSVSFDNQGDVAVLDIQKSSVLFYSPDGEFIQAVGRKGSGPGEFLLPVAVSISREGCLVVADAMGSKIVFFDPDYELLSETTGFSPSPPAQIVALDSMEIVGMKPQFEQNENGMSMGFQVARWNMESADPKVIYYDEMQPFDPSDLSSFAGTLLSFAASFDGTVFTAPLSSEEYTFTAWGADGTELYTFIKDDFERVAKTQQEIDAEEELVNAKMISQGLPPSMANWEPDPYKMAIKSMYVDGYNRLWVERGTTETPVFDVYDLAGNFLFSAAVNAENWSQTQVVVIDRGGFICFDSDPEDYPRVFFGSLPEPR